MKPRIVFMGTPDFAVPILEALIQNYDVVLVVSQPDKPIGRKQILTPTPIKEVALKHHIPVHQPEKIKLDYAPIEEVSPDLIITCAYGQIIPESILNIPTIGCFNVHASLLPKYRGGAPIHHALMNGEEKTGVTIMYMDKGMDTGDIIEKEEYIIKETDNVGTLHEELSKIGSRLLLKVLPSIISKTNHREKQKEEEATYAYNIKREEERIDFSKKGKDIINLIRGLNPWPTANMLVNEEEYKVLEARFTPKDHVKINQVEEITKNAIGIGCADGIIYITKLKPFGKKELLTKDYLNGMKKENILEWKIN